MPVPAAQQSHVSDTCCDRNASQNRRSPSRSRLFDTNESQENYQRSLEQVFRTPNVSFERGTREFPQWDEETEVKQIQ